MGRVSALCAFNKTRIYNYMTAYITEVKKENVLKFHEGTEIVGSFVWKAWLPQNLVSNKFDHTTNAHTTPVGDSSENNVGLLDKYRRSP